MNATVFTHPEQPQANLTCGLRRRAKKYLTWYFNGTPFVVYNSFDQDGVALRDDLSGLSYSIHKNTTLHLFPPYLPGTYECVTGRCTHLIRLIVNQTFPGTHLFPRTGGELRKPPGAQGGDLPSTLVGLGFFIAGLLALLIKASLRFVLSLYFYEQLNF